MKQTAESSFKCIQCLQAGCWGKQLCRRTDIICVANTVRDEISCRSVNAFEFYGLGWETRS